MYLYVLDNNEKYQEDHDIVELFCTELLDPQEFEQIVHKASELCESVYYRIVAEKIVEIDARFFFPPKPMGIAFIGMTEDEYEDKVRGFYHHH